MLSFFLLNMSILTYFTVVASWKEPVEGWTVSKNGPQGFIMGASKGVVRRLPVNTSLIYDYIPVDVVINSIITGTWFSAQLPDRYMFIKLYIYFIII